MRCAPTGSEPSALKGGLGNGYTRTMSVFAYLDPGTGTLIVQAILGGTAGVAVLFKTMGGKFRRKKDSEEPAAVEGTAVEIADVDESNAKTQAAD